MSRPTRARRAVTGEALPAVVLPERFWAKVDKEGPGGCWIWTASKCSRGYGRFGWGKRPQLAHRLAFAALVHPLVAGEVVDHICHNPSCVNPAHLQAVSQSENQENRLGPQPGTSSGVRGVHWCSTIEKWVVKAKRHGRTYYGGQFERGDLAAAAEAAVALRNRIMTNNLVDRGIA